MAELRGFFTFDVAPASDSPTIHYLWRIQHAPADIIEKSEQPSSFVDHTINKYDVCAIFTLFRSFQVGREKYHVPWLFVINRKSSEVPMIDVHLRYSGGDLLGVTAKVIDMPHHYIELHPDIGKHFWDPQHWPKHVLARYTWEEQSEIDVASGFYVLFGSGVVLSFILAVYTLQSSRDKLEKFVRETVAETSIPGVVVAKVE